MPHSVIMAEDSKLVQLRLTNLQIECMKAYFLHYDWEFNPVYVDIQCKENACTPETEVETRNSDPLISPDAIVRVCEHCLCSPCVLDKSNRQSWWPSDCIQPRRTNNTKRKILYKNFWTMLCHRGVLSSRSLQ